MYIYITLFVCVYVCVCVYIHITLKKNCGERTMVELLWIIGVSHNNWSLLKLGSGSGRLLITPALCTP